MALLKKELLRKMVLHINKKAWWHVPPSDPNAYRKRGKFLASSFQEAELYGRPLDQPEKIIVANPLVGDEDTICRFLFGKTISVPEPDEKNFLEQRLALDAHMKQAALEKGFDSIVVMHSRTFAVFKRTGKIPKSKELNILNPVSQNHN